jgi:precorrin-6A/cobalt-precorrin-6A reductase
MKILLLGGTQEGKRLAERLTNHPQIELIYSTRKQVTPPTAGYTTIHGGFGGAEGLAERLQREQFELVLDMTYPYAAQMSRNAAIAVKISNTPLWFYQRPRWIAQPNEQWLFYDSLAEIIPALTAFKRCFFSMNDPCFQNRPAIPNSQQWFVRSRSNSCSQNSQRLTFIDSFESESVLFKTLKIDALISYDSGGNSAKTKIEAAKAVSIPVFFIKRPTHPEEGEAFTNISAIEQTLSNLIATA